MGKKFQLYFSNFWSPKPWIRIDPDPYPVLLEKLGPDPYPDPDSINPGPQHLVLLAFFVFVVNIRQFALLNSNARSLVCY